MEEWIREIIKPAKGNSHLHKQKYPWIKGRCTTCQRKIQVDTYYRFKFSAFTCSDQCTMKDLTPKVLYHIHDCAHFIQEKF